MTQWNEVARTKAEEIDPTVAGGDLAMGFEAPAGRSQWRLAFRRFLRHRVAMVGVVALLIIVFACFVGASFAPSPTEQHLLEPQAGPSAAHWFGTDELSRDTLSRVLHGGQVSIRVGLGVAILSTIIGTLVGLLAGFYGGLRDDVFMRVTDLSIALPSLPLLALAESIGVVTILGFSLDLGSPNGITILVSLLLWGSIARVVRGVTLSLREKEFVEAAGALGASNRRIIMRHILPNCVGPIIVNATLTVATAILLETTLSFLGFGIQPPAASWGNLVSGSLDSLQDHWWQTVFPGMAIFITVLAVNFVGDGLRDALDPKQRQLRA
jgi:peptide/nickel transport system permease protein